MLDFHVHLARFKQPEELCRELEKLGYEAVLVACEPWEWETAERLLEKFPESLSPCFGIHPMMASRISGRELQKLEGLLERHPYAFVGECGLDKRFEGYAPGGIQEEILRFQAQLAVRRGRPLELHVVGDYRRILGILEETPGVRPVFHRFGGDREIVSRAKKWHPIYSIHRDSLKKKSTRAALPSIPEQDIRFETDADESFPVKDSEGKSKSANETAKDILCELLETKRAFDALARRGLY